MPAVAAVDATHMRVNNPGPRTPPQPVLTLSRGADWSMSATLCSCTTVYWLKVEVPMKWYRGWGRGWEGVEGG